MNVSVLGTEYAIEIKKYDDDADFERLGCSGYCSSMTKQIVICDMATYKGWERETKEVCDRQIKETLRHEIIHAFFNESGLSENSNPVESAWARNEEMVDWFALQGPKIYKAWQEAKAL